LALTAISTLDNIERGSLSDAKKVKSFLGRWFEKTRKSKIEDKFIPQEDAKDKEE